MKERDWTPEAIALHLVVAVLAVISLTPFVWLICATFKTSAELLSSIREAR